MNKEFSCGAVVFRREGHVTTYLMIYSGRSKAWGFPKGHTESGESEKETALREIQEETGIRDLKFIDGFREENVYTAKSNRGQYNGQDIEKLSIYYLCETQAKDVVVDAKEITGYKWLPIREAEKLLTFDSLKQILRRAERFSHVTIPLQEKWKRVAISHKIDRYVLYYSNHELPYYEVEWIGLGREDHNVYFIVPRNSLGVWTPTKRDLIDNCNPYGFGPYYDHLKAIREDSRKRGLPSDLEE